MTKNTIRVMMIGDVSGQSGMGALFLGLSSAIKQYNADFVILNGENAAGGFGITIEDYNNMKKAGVDVITSGNHIWQKDEIFPFLDRNDDILRPANYPEPCIGRGMTIKEKNGVSVSVIKSRHIAYLSLGSNMGDRGLNINKAIELLNENDKTIVTKYNML